MKFLVVPDSSERCTGSIFVDGSLASGLSALMAASSQVVILPSKMAAMVLGARLRLSTPSTLKTTAIGLT